MPGPYINQAPVDDDSEMRSESDRPQGTDPQTMAILGRILSLLEAQTNIPPPPGMAGGADPLGMMGGGMQGPPRRCQACLRVCRQWADRQVCLVRVCRHLTWVRRLGCLLWADRLACLPGCLHLGWVWDPLV